MNIYVGNLSYSLSEDELKDAFAVFGEVESARIVKDRDSGRSKGFGFVEMPDKGAAEAAIEKLNGSEIGGRKIVANESRPREDKRPSGGFERRGGSRGGGFSREKRF